LATASSKLKPQQTQSPTDEEKMTPEVAVPGAGRILFARNLLADTLSLQEHGNYTISLHDIDPIRLEAAEADGIQADPA
jgi:hypothetical protein